MSRILTGLLVFTSFNNLWAADAAITSSFSGVVVKQSLENIWVKNDSESRKFRVNATTELPIDGVHTGEPVVIQFEDRVETNAVRVAPRSQAGSTSEKATPQKPEPALHDQLDDRAFYNA